jgi:hypothetical protein
LRTHFLKTNPPAELLLAQKKKEAADKTLANFKATVPRVMVMSDSGTTTDETARSRKLPLARADVHGATPGLSARSGKRFAGDAAGFCALAFHTGASADGARAGE